MSAVNLADLEKEIGGINDEEAEAQIKPLRVWPPSRFIEWTEPPGNHLLLPAYLSKGSLTALIGQGGIGKSRLALWLAICQILNREWCGIQVGGKPQKWLFLSDENGIARVKDDLTHIFSILSHAELSLLERFLRLPALVELGDCDVWLGDPTTIARVEKTIQVELPGVIVVDPLTNFAPGDVAKPGEMKEAIRVLVGMIRRSAPEAAILLLHHARTGRANIAQGVGFDAANFAMGGKALFSAARCVMNLMPGKSDDDTRLVLACAKANNCERFPARGLIFEPRTFTYSTDPGFEVEAWLADVEGRAKSGQSLCTVEDVTSAIRDGYTATKSLVEHLTEACATPKRTVERLISKAVKCEAIKSVTRGKFTLGPKSANYLREAR